MARSPDSIALLKAELSDFGLVCFGGLVLTENECLRVETRHLGKSALLVGNAGADMWQYFSHSGEYADGMPDPMNRWTRRILGKLADRMSCDVFYPFDEPYWPFQRIARKATGISPSPLGILIHPDFGLWHAFRGLLVFDDSHEFSIAIKAMQAVSHNLNHPCDACADKPCLTACPVGSFTGEKLEVAACFGHLDKGENPNCMREGCRARCACPVGKNYEYAPAQLAFHMRYYRGA